MDTEWNASQPIYVQVRDRIAAMILDGALREGDALPSVRTVAADSRVNPLTVLKGYQQLVDEGVVVARRGLGMYVLDGAKVQLRRSERDRFLHDVWPGVRETIDRLGLDAADLLARPARRRNARKDED
jgi:GntR family transcriptional regulator